MVARIATLLGKGILGGSLVGLCVGVYALLMTYDYVCGTVDFSHPHAKEIVGNRYRTAVPLAFIIVFAAIGPFIAGAKFGSWLRHAVYGMTAVIALVVLTCLAAAAMTNQQPFNMHKGSNSEFVKFAREYSVPFGFVVGSIVGMAFGRWRYAGASSNTEYQ